MRSAPVSSREAGTRLSEPAREAWKTGAGPDPEPEPHEPLLDQQALDRLTTMNARLVSRTAGSFPESPLYPAILMVALIGALIDFLFLIR